MPIADLLDSFAEEDKAALTRSALIAHNTDPDRHAVNMQTAQRQGIPTAFATPATKLTTPADLTDLMDTFHKLQTTSPVTAKFVSNPDKAKVAHDDTGVLSELGNAFKGAGSRVAQGVNASMGSVMNTFTGTPGIYQEGVDYWGKVAGQAGVNGIAGKVYEGIGAAPVGIAEFVANVPYAMLKGGVEGYRKDGVTGLVQGAITEAVKRYGVGKVFKGIEASGMSRTAKSLTMAGTMGGQTAAEGGNAQDVISSTIVGLALVPPGARTKGDTVRTDLIKRGVDPKIAGNIGALADGMENYTKVAPQPVVEPVAGASDNVGNFLKSPGTGGAMDPREQRIVELAQALDGAVLNRDGFLDALENQKDPLLAELMAAGRTRQFDLVGDGMLETPYRPDFTMTGRTPDDIYPPVTPPATRGPVLDAERPIAGLLSYQNADNITKVVETAKKSKLKKRSPQDFKEFVQSADEAPPVTMPVEKLEEIAARAGVKAEDVLADPEALHTARMEDKPVEVALSDIAALADHVTPEDIKVMSVGDAPSMAELSRQRDARQQSWDAANNRADASTNEAVKAAQAIEIGTPDALRRVSESEDSQSRPPSSVSVDSIPPVAENVNTPANYRAMTLKPSLDKTTVKTIDDVQREFVNGNLFYEGKSISDTDPAAVDAAFLALKPRDATISVGKDRITIKVKGEPLTAAELAENARVVDAAMKNGNEVYAQELAMETRKPDAKHVFFFNEEGRKTAAEAGGADLAFFGGLTQKLQAEARRKMIEIAKEDPAFKKDPTFTVQQGPEGIFSLQFKTGKREYNFVAEAFNINPGTGAVGGKTIVKAGDTIKLSPGFLDGKQPEVFIVPESASTELLYAGLPVPPVLTWLKRIPAVKETLDWMQSIVNLPSMMLDTSQTALGKLRGTRNQYADKLSSLLQAAEKNPDTKTAVGKFIKGTLHLDAVFERRGAADNATFFDKLRSEQFDQMTIDEQKVFAIGQQLDKEFADLVRMVDPAFPLRENHGMMTLHWVKDAAESDTPFAYLSARLEGNTSFKKKYSGRTATDIMADGYTAELNPIKVLRRSLSDHIKYVSGAQFLQEGMQTGRHVFVPLGEERPAGMEKTPDVAAKVFKRIQFPEEITGNEHVDKAIYDGLMKVADNLGIPDPVRKVKTGSNLGTYQHGTDQVTTRRNTDLSVLAHEIGHAIDLKDGDGQKLWRSIVEEASGTGKRGTETKAANHKARSIIKAELRAIADMMGERGGKGYTRKKVEQIAQMVELYIHAPDLMREEAPNVYAAFDAYVKADPQLAPMAGLRPGAQLKGLGYEIKIPQPIYVKSFNVLDEAGEVVRRFPKKEQAQQFAEANGYLRTNSAGEQVPNTQIKIGKPTTVHAGDWYMPKTEAVALKRYLEADTFRRNPIVSGLLELKGAFTSAELYGLFHFSNIAEEGIRAKSADVLRSVMAGDYIGARENMKAASGYGMLDMANRMLRDPENFAADPVVTAKLQRAGMTPQQFETAVNDLYHGGLKLHSDDLATMKGSLSAALERGAEKYPVLEGVRLTRDALMSVTDALFSKFVPDLKLSAAISNLRTNEKLYADRIASGELTREQMIRDTVNSVENRFGQLNYENLMLPKAFKTALQLVFRAPGWNIGTWREMPNAIRKQAIEVQRAMDKGEKSLLTQEFSWLVSTVALHVVEAALIGYVAAWATGNEDLKPQEWNDYVFPKIAAMTRIVPPGYLKEVFSMYHDIQKAPFYIPVNYLQSKLTGYWGRLAEIFRNKDYYGQEVRDPEDPTWKQALSVSGHMIPTPLFVRSIMAQREQGVTNPAASVASFLGFSKAPSWIERTPAQSMIGDMVAGQYAGADGMSAEQMVQKKARRGIVRHLRDGGTFDTLPDNLQEQMHTFTAAQIKAMDADSSLTPLQSAFKRLQDPTLEKSIKVWAKAGDEERDQLRDLYETRIDRYFLAHDQMSEEEISRINERIRKAEERKL